MEPVLIAWILTVAQNVLKRPETSANVIEYAVKDYFYAEYYSCQSVKNMIKW